MLSHTFNYPVSPPLKAIILQLSLQPIPLSGLSPQHCAHPLNLSFPSQVLFFDSTSIEAIACLAAHHFYTDQPEIALRYYRRLLQV